jgi:pyruvate kinase
VHSEVRPDYNGAMKRSRIHWRRTKIVCTLGPATSSEKTIGRLIEAGMDVARLNLSHGSLEEHARFVETVRRIAGRSGANVAVMLDLPGPKHRIGKLAGGSVTLRRGRTVTLTERPVEGTESLLPVTLPNLAEGLRPGQMVLLDDGVFKVKVTEIRGHEVIGRVVVGGVLGEGKGVVVPGMPVTTPFLTEGLRQMIEFAVSQRPDFLALSFVATQDDVTQVRSILRRQGTDIPLISKIERRDALTHFDSILQASDAIMVARGDLGVEIPLERVPLVQKELIKKCNQAAKPVITATEMLQSMVTSARPMRAEASDIANAIFDGTDAVMLSGETSVGKYPVLAVKAMDRIARETEKDLPYELSLSQRRDRAAPMTEELIGYNACVTAQSLGAKAIVAFTQSGATAARVARYRPRPVILAVTPSDILGRLELIWGVHAFKKDVPSSTSALFSIACDLARELGLVRSGDLIVVTGGIPLGRSGSTNLLKVETIK